MSEHESETTNPTAPYDPSTAPAGYADHSGAVEAPTGTDVNSDDESDEEDSEDGKAESDEDDAG